MYKRKSASMQRGDRRDEYTSSAQLYADGAKIKLSTNDLPHFDKGGETSKFMAALAVAVRHLAKNGFRKPAEVARLLNKQRVFTACNRPWTPRLAWLLLNKIYSGTFDGPAMTSIPKPQRKKKQMRLWVPKRKISSPV